MLKVVLIEDEAVVLKGMTKVLEREPDVDLAGTAENGKDGLRLIQNTQPDLVLTDIRMPGLTGLEMIEQAKQQFPDIVYIIFSGFNEFKYVQKAIGLGVLDYLEKPVTVSHLKEALHKAKDMIDYKKSYIQMKERAVKVNRVLVEQALLNILNHPAEMEKECMEQLLEQNGDLRYATEIAVMCAGQVFHPGNRSDQYRNLIQEMTFSVVQGHSFEIYTLIADEKIFFVFFNQECEIFPYYEKMEEAKKSLEEQGISFYAGLSSICQNIFELKHAFSEAQSALNYAVFLEEERIVRITDVEYGNNMLMKITDSQYSLEFNFRTQNYEECRKQICSYLESLKRGKLMPEFMRHECMKLLDLLQSLVRETGCEICEDGQMLDYSGILKQSSAEMIAEWTAGKAEMLLNLMQEKQKDTVPNAAEMMKKYIDKHYSEGISLDLLAEQVHMNPTYLSVAFKKAEGLTYSSYLTQVRLRHATELLEKGEKAKDVCEKVGYLDYRYFNKQFKKYYGMTPDTYKRSRLGKKI
ncbi:MAG TPA: response regulator [Candidatus Mediterraneibacter norfolkensis]|nr:response regulator [Candidatus Mediterraneibacter norfolkensis]